MDLVVVGAMKAGTTTLHTYLARSGEFLVPRSKELHSLSESGLAEHAPLEEEMRHPGRRAFVQPNLLTSRVAIQRVPSKIPDATYAALLRDPFERAESHFLMTTKRGRERRTFTEAIASDLDAWANGRDSNSHESYVSRGMYGHFLSQWRDNAGVDISVFAFELVQDPLNLARELASTLGMSSLNFGSATVANSSQSLRNLGSLESRIRSTTTLKRIWHLVPARLRTRYSMMTHLRTIDHPDLQRASSTKLDSLPRDVLAHWIDAVAEDIVQHPDVHAIATEQVWRFVSEGYASSSDGDP